MNTIILPITSRPRKVFLQSGRWISFGKTGNFDPPPVRESALHRFQVRARAVIRKDVQRKSFKKESGDGGYFTPIIWSLIFAEGAVLVFLTMVAFL